MVRAAQARTMTRARARSVCGWQMGWSSCCRAHWCGATTRLRNQSTSGRVRALYNNRCSPQTFGSRHPTSEAWMRRRRDVARKISGACAVRTVTQPLEDLSPHPLQTQARRCWMTRAFPKTSKQSRSTSWATMRFRSRGKMVSTRCVLESQLGDVEHAGVCWSPKLEM